jgi:hypothetical protein
VRGGAVVGDVVDVFSIVEGSHGISRVSERASLSRSIE